MVGHGRPNSLSRCWHAWLRAAFCAALYLLIADLVVAEEEVSMRLRVAWGGGTAKRWEGAFKLSAGKLSNPQPLGVEADEPGSMWALDDMVHVAQKSARSYDALDVDVRAPLSATLSVQMQDADAAPTSKVIDIPLATLLKDTATHDLDHGHTRLIVRRAPGDALNVDIARGSLVFAPGETFDFTVTPRLLGAELGSRVRLRFQLQETNGGRVLWTQEAEQAAVEGDGTRVPLQVALPPTEGVYELQIEAHAKRNPLALSLKQQAIATRRVQLVVVGKEPVAAGESTLATVFEFDPARPHWWERLTNFSALPANRRGPMGTGHAHVWQHTLGAMVQLAPGPNEESPSWEAYPIEIQQIGQPHVVEIEYPSDVPQTLTMSIVEPNSAGAVTAIGLDTGIYVPDEAAAAEPAIQTHKVVFWPKTRNPLLLMSNLRTASQAVYGRIRVSVSSGHLPSAAPSNENDQRLIAGYYDRPLFPENFGAMEAFDTAAGRSLDDWNTFYQGSTRLAEYLKFAGYNGLMLSVLADGSSIYPSDRLQSTPRYDNGVFLSLGQDPVRKDVVELALRVFDREKLQLIPALSLGTPLPELEGIKRHGGADAAGLDWIGRDGRPWTERNRGDRGQAPYYNTLHPRVQQAILSVVEEFATRYTDHASFKGLALQLTADGYLQLPGVNWGFDDQTVAMFESETGTQIKAHGANRFAERATLLLGTNRQAWTEWRAKRMLDFYRQVQAKLAEVRPDLKLYLAGAEVFKSGELRTALRPTLPARPLDETMLEIGLDIAQLAQLPNVVLLRPQQFSAPSPRATPLLDLKVNDAAELDRDLREASSRGAIFFHPPNRMPLPSFDERSPYRDSQLWLVAQLTPGADRNRQRFVRSIATLDSDAMFDGGWLLNLGQEETLRELMHTFRRLPVAPWQTLETDSQPVTIRSCVHQGKRYAYLVNDSPWPVAVSLAMSHATVTELTGLRTLGTPQRADQGASLRVELRAYDLIALTSPQPDWQITSASVTLPDSAESGLQDRIQDFQARLIALQNQPALDLPANSGFEGATNEDGSLSGWQHNSQAGITADLDSQRKQSGSNSVKFSSNGPLGVLASDLFEVPATGRLELAVWLCVADEKNQPSFRVALEGTHKGERFYRHAQLGSGQGAVPLTGKWSQYVAAFDNLPIDGSTSLRVRFELLGRGDVWIDAVQLYHLRFTDAERFELFKLATSAQLKLKDGHVGDCMRLLEGYWPQFLIAQVPLTEAPLAQRPLGRPATPAEQTPPAAAPAAPSGGRLFDQLKSWVPKWR